MKTLIKVLLSLSTLSLLTMPAMAEKTALMKSEQPGTAIILEAQRIALKKADFELFAKKKVQHLNKSHQFSRSRMQIVKKADGSYLARFHQIDDSSLTCKVRRSQSKTIPYVGVLSYHEKIFEASGDSPEDARAQKFVAVKIIPNKHIFSYKGNAWK